MLFENFEGKEENTVFWHFLIIPWLSEKRLNRDVNDNTLQIESSCRQKALADNKMNVTENFKFVL